MKFFNLSEWSLRHPSLSIYFMLALFLAGVMAYMNLGQAEDPEFTIKTMAVRTFWPGATALEVEQQITDRIETKLQETPWLDFLSSYSKPGESMVFVELKDYTPATEVPDAWYQVRKKLDDIRHTFPEGVRGPFPNDEFGDTFGTIYALTADGISYADLRDYVDDIRQELLRVPDVAKVDLIGVQEEKIFVELSNAKLSNLGLDPVSIFETLAEQNNLTPAGVVQTASDAIHLRVSGVDSVAAIREIGIRGGDRLFRLGDVADVYRAYVDPPVFKMRFRGEEAIGLAVSMRQGGNVLELGEALAATMDRVESELPIGIDVHKVADQPTIVKRSVNEFLKVLAEAVSIVLLVSFLSLGLRTGFVVALSIPLVLAATFLGMKLVGIDLQRISLGALIIALGLLVDDAMISIEMMAIKMEQGWDRFKAAGFAYTSTAFPMLTGTLITTAGFLPVFLAKSSASEYTGSIFVVVGLSLLISWVVAVLFIPFLGYRLLPDFKRDGHDGNAVYQRPFYARFRRLVTLCVRWRKTVILITLLVFAGSLFAFKFVEQQFFPASNRLELLVDLWLPQGASFAANEARAKKLESLLEDDTDIVSYVAYVGGGSPRFYLPLAQELRHSNLTQFVVMTRDTEAREKVRSRLLHAFEQGFPELRGRVQRLENGPPVGYPLQFRVTGPDKDKLRAIAGKVADIMRTEPNADNVHLNWNELSKVVRLEIDQDKARVLGISSQRLASVLDSILNGYSVTNFRDGNRLIEVLARAESGERLSLQNLDDIRIPNDRDRFVPLGQLVTLSYELEEGLIWRRDLYPTITVRADVRGSAQAPDVTARIDPLLDPVRAELPVGYRIDVGGAVESSAKGSSSIAKVMPFMVLVVFTLLMIQLQSFQRAIIVLITAPLGLIGVTWALLSFQAPFGFVANLGVIALSGMIMRNSVILVDQIEQDRQAGRPLWEAIIESTVRRLRPIALTAAAAVLAMIPLTQSTFWGPMAIAIMGGLLVATVLTLLFLPALYAAWFRAEAPVQGVGSAL
ncbi:MAG: efflux RND transporter permease subunit [Acidimicrobiia bacterium]|nr:efflux RND transporter permease subunit [Acidimicrobiia bacterium]